MVSIARLPAPEVVDHWLGHQRHQINPVPATTLPQVVLKPVQILQIQRAQVRGINQLFVGLRFQRIKAASLVSSKRNFNVGDSTWPSQNTTLALP